MIWWSKQQLKSKDAKVRQRAIESILAEGGAKAGKVFVEALKDGDPAVRRAVVTALGELRDDSAAPPLAGALRDPDDKVRAAAAKALGRLRGAETETALVAALQDPVSAVRWQAARVLEEWNWPPKPGVERAAFYVALGKLELAANEGPEAIDPLSLVLRTGAYQERHAAVLALGRIPDARVQKALLAALSDREDQVRCAAVEALGRLGDRRTAVPLVSILTDKQKNVRAAAAEVLGHLGNPAAVEPLRGLLKDHAWEVRQAAVLSLGRLRDKVSLAVMTEMLHDREHEVRETACRALELLGEPGAITALVLALKDEKPNVRQRATAALTSLDRTWWQTDAARAAAPQLQAVLQHNDYWVRQSAADVLARLTHTQTAELRGLPPTLPTLAAPLHFRRQAAVETLTSLLWDFDPELRVAAADALAAIGQTATLPALVYASKDAHPAVQAAAARAVVTLKAALAQSGDNPTSAEIFPF